MARNPPSSRTPMYVAAIGCMLAAAKAEPATTYGPGDVISPVTVSTADGTVVGSTTISVTGNGVRVINGRTATLDPTQGSSPGPIVINATGYGLYVYGATGVINPGDGGVSITTSGNANTATGILVQTNSAVPGVLNADGVSIITNGNNAHGIWVYGAGANANVNNARITTGGASGTATLAYGMMVNGSATASLSNSTISTSGPGGFGLYVNSGGSASVTNVDITTSGSTFLSGGTENGSYGVVAAGGSAVTVRGGRIATSGNFAGITGAYGFFVKDAGSTGVISGTTITTTGQIGGAINGRLGANVQADHVTLSTAGDAAAGNVGSYGFNMQERSSGTLTASSIKTYGVTGVGLRASESSSVNASTTTVETFGASGTGAAASLGGNITVNDTQFQTHGTSAAGLLASGTDAAGSSPSRVTATGGSIATSGAWAHGVVARGGGTISLNSVPITTLNQHGIGVVASGANSQVQANGGSVATTGPDGHGAYAERGGLLTVNGTTLTTSGNGAHGLVVDTAATAIVQPAAGGGNASLATTGANADVVRVGSGGAFTAAGATLHASGAGANGLTLMGGTGSVGLGTVLTGERDGAADANGGESALLLAPASVIAPSLLPKATTPQSVETAKLTDTVLKSDQGAAIAVIGPDATVTLTRATVSGATALLSVSAGAAGPGVAVVNADASTLTGAALTDVSSTSTLHLANASTWHVTANSTLTNLANNASLIAFTPPATGGFKTLTAQHYSGTGGVIALNTVLGADGSASDKLVINGGAATGTTGLRVANAGGAGALTVASGIQVVDAIHGGTTAADAFALDGRAVAGAYEYRLFRGSADGSNPDAWYLRSEATSPVPDPLYRPEIAAYLANQRLVGEMFVHSLHDRLGEPQYVEGQGFDPEQDKARAGWLRVVGNWQGSKSANGIFTARTNSFLLHGGAEVASWKAFSEGGDRGHLGLMGSYGYANTNASAQGNPFTAKGTVEGWSVGGYGTWYQNDAHKLGAYVDTWFQYGWFTNHVDGQYLPSVRYNAQGWAASGETGYAVPLRNDWVVEPQGQLIYVGYNESDVTEPNGTSVRGANSHGWITRLGARFHRTFLRPEDRKIQPYLTLNWWHTSVSSSISFNDLPLGSMYPSNRYEVKLGVNADLGKRWTAWGNVSGAWGAQSFYQYALRAGVKYAW